jgi:endonuclease/exonuclease/phosphatase family metal-dependent hydrolase
MVRVLTWNLFHGRDFPPDHALFTWRSRLFRLTERNPTHVQVNRDLFDEFASVLSAEPWDVALLQECPPHWADDLARHCHAGYHRCLTSRNWLPRLQAFLARLNPDLLASGEGGSNTTLVRSDAILERRDLELRPSPFRHLHSQPERRTMAFTRLASGLCIANLHASQPDPALAGEDVLKAARQAVEWAGEQPLIFGGDFNLRPNDRPDVFELLERELGLFGQPLASGIDHLLARGQRLEDGPSVWPPEQREVAYGDRRLRLSDHAPVEATFGPD